MQEHKEKVTLLFGTQTGTAERFAKQLKTELQQKYGDDTLYNVLDIEDYKHEDKLQDEKLVILMLATYGDGEPTDNAANFFNWLQESAGEAKEDESKKILTVSPYCQEPNAADMQARAKEVLVTLRPVICDCLQTSFATGVCFTVSMSAVDSTHHHDL